MKLLKRIQAIFNFKGQHAEMELKSAEIRGGKVFLHPEDDPKHTFCVSGKTVDILIDPAVELSEDDFVVLDNEKMSNLQLAIEVDPNAPLEKLLQPKLPPEKKKTHTTKESSPPSPDAQGIPKADEKTPHENNPIPKEQKNAEPQSTQKSYLSYSQYIPKMRTVSMRLYQEEYEMLIESISANGYKKTEYLLVCVAAAKKKSMETAYQRYYTEHQRRRKTDREAVKRAGVKQVNQENQARA